MPGKLETLTDVLMRVVDRANPVASRPSAPLEAGVWLDSFEPSLMPRTSQLQGVAGGLGVLSVRALSGLVEATLPPLEVGTARARRRYVIRAATGLAGAAIAQLPYRDGESLWRSGARTVGRLLGVASAGGALHDASHALRARYPASRSIRPIAIATTTAVGLGLWAGRRLTERTAAVEPWPVEQRSTVPGSLAATAATTALGMGLARGFVLTRDRWVDYLGASVPRQVLARAINGAIWAAGTTAAYHAGVGYVGRANAKVEPGYSEPPATPSVSGSTSSLSPFEDLGQQGRRYVTDVLTPELITAVMDEPASHPIRVFVGFDSEPLYLTGRAELALEELDRTGAYDRRYLLLVSPTGTGWVDQTLIESVELMARGDVATVAIQYGRFPSFLSIQKVALGKGQFRLLLIGIKERLRERPPEQRPTILVFGESLGAWTSSDVVMFQGIEGFDHYGIDRALWVGLPGLAKWSRNGMARGSSDLVPEGSVLVVDRPEQLEGSIDDVRDRLRAVILSHDNDPIAQLVPDLFIQRPLWLGDERGRGVPERMRWRPLLTFWQTAIDAANAMVTIPGEFRSFGHDYRADMARVVRHAYPLPGVTEQQLDRIEAVLRRQEVERAARIDAASRTTAPPPPVHRVEATGRRIVGGVPLKVRRTGGPRWLARVAGPGASIRGVASRRKVQIPDPPRSSSS
jgi:uncharacterized membrane protein